VTARALLLLSLAGVVLAGCATAPDPRGGRYVVSSPRAPFYKYGPAQAFGADFALNRGQKVTVVENSLGFSKVMTDDGQAGYMPTDDLAPAPPEAPPQPVRVSRTVSRRGRGGVSEEPPPSAPRKSKPSTVEPGLPLFDANDIPLPTNAPPAKP
jgi:hypothetical protein